jgi:hypothetical protein
MKYFVKIYDIKDFRYIFYFVFKNNKMWSECLVLKDYYQVFIKRFATTANNERTSLCKFIKFKHSPFNRDNSAMEKFKRKLTDDAVVIIIFNSHRNILYTEIHFHIFHTQIYFIIINLLVRYSFKVHFAFNILILSPIFAGTCV